MTIKRKDSILIFCAIVFAWGIIGSLIRGSFKKVNNSIALSSLQEVVNDINKMCPKNIDSVTVLKSALLKNNRVIMNYTVLGVTDSFVDSSVIKPYVKQLMINNINTNADFKTFRDDKIELQAFYADETGKSICNVLVEPKDYLPLLDTLQ